MEENRLDQIERKIENISSRLRRLEQTASGFPVEAEREVARPQQRVEQAAASIPVSAQPPSQPQQRQPASTPRPEAARPIRQKPSKAERPSIKDTTAKLEELLGGRLLAWAGGAAFIIGVGYFFALAISNGWIGEGMRVALGFTASAALLAGGVLLHEKKGHTQASLASAGAGIAGLYLSLVAATQLYELIPTFTALVVALGIGFVGTVVAVRLSSQVVGGLGLIGAMLAPALVGAEASGTAVSFILVALAATVGVLAWKKWWWLAYAAFLVCAPQVIDWVDSSQSGSAVALVLGIFLVLNILAVIGHELRVPSKKVWVPSLALLTAATAVVALAGYFKLDSLSYGPGAEAWLVGLAVFHLALGLTFIFSDRFNRILGIWIAGKGVALADVSFGLIGSGPVLSTGWSVSAVFFAYIGFRSSDDKPAVKKGVLAKLALTSLSREIKPHAALVDKLALKVGVLAQLTLAAAYILISEAAPESVSAGPESLAGAIIGLATFALALFACARLMAKENRGWMVGLDLIGFASLAYLAAVAVDGVAVTVAWAFLGCALVATYSKIGFNSDDEKIYIQASAAALLQMAALHILTIDAVPESVTAGPDNLAAAIIGLTALAAALFTCARILPGENRLWSQALDLVGFASLAYLAAVALDGLWVVVALVGLGVAAAVVRKYLDRTVAMAATGACLAGALLHSLALEAVPVSLLDGLSDVPDALVSLLAVVVGCFVVGFIMRDEEAWWKPTFYVGGGAALLYLASTLIITPFQPGESLVNTDLASLDVRQQGQMLLSIFWAITGLALLAYGLVRDKELLRLGGFGLLVIAIAKVFTYDLSTLDSIYRVLSLVVLGLLLLVSAYTYQRVRTRKKEAIGTN